MTFDKDTQDLIRRIVKEELDKRDQMGKVSFVQRHLHDGTDGLKIPYQSIKESLILPATPGSVLDPAILDGRVVFWNQLPASASDSGGKQQVVPILPLPIISGDIGVESLEFTGDTAQNAPDGTLLIYKEGAAWQLWICLFGSWHGVDLPLTPA